MSYTTGPTKKTVYSHLCLKSCLGTSQSLLVSTLNNLRPLSLSLEKRCSIPLTTSVALLWTTPTDPCLSHTEEMRPHSPNESLTQLRHIA